MILTKFGTVEFFKSQNTGHQVVGRPSLLPLARGSFDQDGQSFYAQAHNITHQFVLIERPSATISEQLDELQAQMSKGRNILQAITRDKLEIQTFAKLLNFDYAREEGSTRNQPITAIFEIDHPYWYAVDDESLYFDTGWLFDAGYFLDSGNKTSGTLTSRIETFDLSYTGNVRLYKSYIVVSPQSGASLTEITIRNITTDEQITWTDTLSYPNELIFEMLTETVLLNGTGDYSNFSRPSSQIGWLTLTPGVNAIKIISEGLVGTIDFDWYWSRVYLR